MAKLKNISEGTRCWKGYEKKGMKTMFGKRVPNCVKKETKLPDDGFSDKEIKWPAWTWREEITKEKSLIYGKFF